MAAASWFAGAAGKPRTVRKKLFNPGPGVSPRAESPVHQGLQSELEPLAELAFVGHRGSGAAQYVAEHVVVHDGQQVELAPGVERRGVERGQRLLGVPQAVRARRRAAGLI